MDKKIIPVKGMTCSACEMLIKSELAGFPGVKSVEASTKAGEVVLEVDSNYNHHNVVKAISKLGYTPEVSGAKKSGTWQDWIMAIMAVGVLALAYNILKNLGLLGFLKVQDASMGYAAAFMIGIAASLSTCLMVVGSVVIAFASRQTDNSIKPHLLFHLGRLGTFALLGGLLGILGSIITISGSFWAVISLAVAVILIWLGLSELGFTKSFSLGSSWANKVFPWWKSAIASKKPWAPLLIGALTFILPCGFTQSMQLYALSTGSFAKAALTLGLFALGTVPVLLALGVGLANFKEKFNTVWLRYALGILIVIFGANIALNGLSILGVNVGGLSAGNFGVTEARAEEQVIEMTVDGRGFTPDSFKLKAGVPVVWKIHGVTVTGCTNRIISKQLNINESIANGENEIKFTPSEAGEYDFSCWMGMVRGKFIVEPKKASLLEKITPQAFAKEPAKTTAVKKSTAKPAAKPVAPKSASKTTVKSPAKFKVVVPAPQKSKAKAGCTTEVKGGCALKF